VEVPAKGLALIALLVQEYTRCQHWHLAQLKDAYNVDMATTTSDAVVSVRLATDLVEQLDELAGEMDRSRSYLIAEAVREFVEREYAHLLHIREGEADIEAGRALSGDEMHAWVKDLKATHGRRVKPSRRSS
jgi:predicted transcriptional regulator